MPEDGAPRADPVTIGSIVVRVLVLFLTIHQGLVGSLSDDLPRFQQIFLSPGTPYRAFPVEYAPGELMFIRLAGSSSIATFATRVAVVAFLADLAAWAAIRWAWGRAPAATYLLLGTPLLLFAYQRFDLVPVAIAAWATALVVRDRERAGGVSFAVAILTKLWPIVIIPMLLVQRRRKAFVYAVATTLLALVVWVWVSGLDALRQVVTFRHATGWGIESVVGSVVWIATGGPVRLEQGTPRVGDVPVWAPVLLGCLLLVLLAAIWILANNRPADSPGAAALAAVGALLACTPLFSLQYAAWLLPWAAIASTNGHKAMVRVVGIVTVLTAALFIVYDPGRSGWSQLLVVARNLAVVALPVMWLAPRVRERLPVPSR